MIQLDHVGVTYPSGAVGLKPTSLRFARGEFAVLLGASGAGKSTLLRCLNLLTEPSAGWIEADAIGRLDSARSIREHRRRTGMVFQQHQLIGRQTALQNVLLGRLAYHSALRSLWPLPRAERLLALHCLQRVGLAHKALARADQLSGGQQQRVGIARALAQKPSLILADEPVASLDPASAASVLGLLRDICRADGITVVLSLHQVDLAKRFADRIIGLAEGGVVFDGPPEALSEHGQSQLYCVPDRRSAPPAAVPTVLSPRVLAKESA